MARPTAAYGPWADSPDKIVEDSLDKVVKPEQIAEDSLDKVVADSRGKVGNQVSRGCSSDRSVDSSDRVTTAKARRRTRSHSRRSRQFGQGRQTEEDRRRQP